MRRILDIVSSDGELLFLYGAIEHSNHRSLPIFDAPVERLEQLVGRGLLIREDFDREHQFIRYTVVE